MRRHCFAHAAVEVQYLDGETRPVNDTVDQRLQPNFVDLRFDGLYLGRAVLVQRHGEEALVPLWIQLHPRASQELQHGRSVGLEKEKRGKKPCWH